MSKPTTVNERLGMEAGDSERAPRASFCSAVFRYAKQRHFRMKHGWGRPRIKGLKRAAWMIAHWLWLDAIAYAVLRTWRLRCNAFNRWCDQVDALFVAQFDWPRSYTLDSGRDCYIDGWAEGMTPQDAVDTEVDHWEP